MLPMLIIAHSDTTYQAGLFVGLGLETPDVVACVLISHERTIHDTLIEKLSCPFV
jgi:hypothetical protein